MDVLLLVTCVVYLVQTIFCHPQVKILQGQLEGRYNISRNGRKFAKFLGIPYAAPPVGELRFKSPQPAVGWTCTREAAEYGSDCPQINFLIRGLENNMTGNEDCLFLDVFTPKVISKVEMFDVDLNANFCSRNYRTLKKRKSNSNMQSDQMGCVQNNVNSWWLYRDSIATGHIPRSWRMTRVVFISKPGKMAPDTNLPVMVWIHGGGFISGSSREYMGPEYIMDKDVVLVTLNYRLGALGFLTTEDEVLPGNFGLKDQTLALQWVRDNIEYFGGNKDSVTIFGQSAGGGSVNLHMMSPLSKGLFHAAIAQSGTAYCPWASYPPGINKIYAQKVGEIVGCPLQDSKQFVKCLRNLPYQKFPVLNSVFTLWNIDPIVVFRPNIEKPSKKAFLSTYPSQLTTSVPYMVGIVSDEGGMRLSSITKDGLDVGMKEINDKFDKIMPVSLMIHEKTQNPKDVVKKIRNFYFGNKEIKKEDLQKAMDMYTDAIFFHGTIKSIHHHKGPAYLYYFNYKGDTSVSHMYGNKKDDFGVAHVDDLLYLCPLEHFYFRKVIQDLYLQNLTEKVQRCYNKVLLFVLILKVAEVDDLPFLCPLEDSPPKNHPRPKPTEEDTKMSEKIVELWTNFATYRNPTPKRSSFAVWEPVTSSDLEYLHISNDGFTMKTNLLRNVMIFGTH